MALKVIEWLVQGPARQQRNPPASRSCCFFLPVKHGATVRHQLVRRNCSLDRRQDVPRREFDTVRELVKDGARAGRGNNGRNPGAFRAFREDGAVGVSVHILSDSPQSDAADGGGQLRIDGFRGQLHAETICKTCSRGVRAVNGQLG